MFELTPREVIFSLLEEMGKYPVLWEHHEEAYNEEYGEAIQYLCEQMNEKWLLKISPIKMRRSITRIFRFYRFLFPFDTIEQFEDYFDKCATFLPSAVIEIPHARCFQCWRCFKRDNELINHLVTEHKNFSPYKCLHCRESFETNEEFEFHKKLPHYLETFTCRECNQKFIEYKSYDYHYPHQKPKLPYRYVCKICQKDFKTKSTLRCHKKSHGERNFKCHLCPKAYHMQSELTRHLMIHQMQTKNTCEVCGKGFIRKKSLKDHMDVHTGFKVKCNICNLEVRKTNFYRHLRTVHVVYAGTIEDNFRMKGYKPKRSIEKRKETTSRHYKCKICKIEFNRCKELRAHNLECHLDLIATTPCKLCKASFSTSNNLKAHYRTKHKLSFYQINDLLVRNLDIETVLANPNGI